MHVIVCDSKADLGSKAAAEGAEAIRLGLKSTEQDVNIVVATGASQFEVLGELARAGGINWERINIFHLDEYIGMPETHPASFRRYLRERLIERLPTLPKSFHAIDAEHDAADESARLSALIAGAGVTVAFIGIGENGHLAFNDPPADFDTDQPYLIVQLDEACRRQQFGEGWFPTLEAVPTCAISMSVRQIMKAELIICSAPEARKSAPVKAAVEGPVTPEVPASVLQRHPNVSLYLDRASAALLTPQR